MEQNIELTEINECQPITKAICNKGFSGNSSILRRSNLGVSGQESSPQSLTAYSLNRYASFYGDSANIKPTRYY